MISDGDTLVQVVAHSRISQHVKNSPLGPSPTRPWGKTDQVNVDMVLSHQSQPLKNLAIF